MKFKTINYGESYESVNTYGLKSWKKLNVEIEIEGNDNPEDAYKAAHQFITEKLNKQMEDEPIIQQRQEVTDELQAFIDEMNTAQAVEELKEKYWLRAKTNLRLTEEYGKKKKQLDEDAAKK